MRRDVFKVSARSSKFHSRRFLSYCKSSFPMSKHAPPQPPTHPQGPSPTVTELEAASYHLGMEGLDKLCLLLFFLVCGSFLKARTVITQEQKPKECFPASRKQLWPRVPTSRFCWGWVARGGGRSVKPTLGAQDPCTGSLVRSCESNGSPPCGNILGLHSQICGTPLQQCNSHLTHSQSAADMNGERTAVSPTPALTETPPNPEILFSRVCGNCLKHCESLCGQDLEGKNRESPNAGNLTGHHCESVRSPGQTAFVGACVKQMPPRTVPFSFESGGRALMLRKEQLFGGM